MCSIIFDNCKIILEIIICTFYQLYTINWFHPQVTVQFLQEEILNNRNEIQTTHILYEFLCTILSRVTTALHLFHIICFKNYLEKVLNGRLFTEVLTFQAFARDILIQHHHDSFRVVIELTQWNPWTVSNLQAHFL